MVTPHFQTFDKLFYFITLKKNPTKVFKDLSLKAHYPQTKERTESNVFLIYFCEGLKGSEKFYDIFIGGNSTGNICWPGLSS